MQMAAAQQAAQAQAAAASAAYRGEAPILGGLSTGTVLLGAGALVVVLFLVLRKR